jgi:hypothetical protein
VNSNNLFTIDEDGVRAAVVVTSLTVVSSTSLSLSLVFFFTLWTAAAETATTDSAATDATIQPLSLIDRLLLHSRGRGGVTIFVYFGRNEREDASGKVGIILTRHAAYSIRMDLRIDRG